MTLDLGGGLTRQGLREGLLALSVEVPRLEAQGGWHSREIRWIGGQDTL